MNKPTIDLTSQQLFGNDAAEDEGDDLFSAYALEREELKQFASNERKISIIRAYKGDGKSALLRLTQMRIKEDKEPQLVISAQSSMLAPALSSASPTPWIRAWKNAILLRVAKEIGAHIGIAWTDDAMMLVEESEKSGFKEKNIITAILQRFQIKLKAAHGPVSIEADVRQGAGATDKEEVVKRWSREWKLIWLFFDDVDQNFQNTPDQLAKVASFFIACRELANAIPELRIRAAVRPNVWTTIKLQHEAMSHVEQYVIDLSWSEETIRRLLAKRIEGYLKITKQSHLAQPLLNMELSDRDKAFISMVFEPQMHWGEASRPPHVLLYTLSKHRPRWMIQLCKKAAQRARLSNRKIIIKEDITRCLPDFGRARMEETVAEFKPQCAEIEEIITAFRKEREQMSTEQLYEVIKNKIISHMAPRIVGVIGTAQARDIAAFLFEIGFIYGRNDKPDRTYDHIGFTDRPHLFRTRGSPDDGLSWEIHPVFRQVLEIRDSEGFEVKKQKSR